MANRRGQTLSEYAMLILLVAAGVTLMQGYSKRGLQAAIKMATDRLSPYGALDPTGEKAQADGMRYEAGDRNQAVVAAGSVLVRKTAARTQAAQNIDKRTVLGGGTETDINQDQATNTGVLTSVTSPVFGNVSLGSNVSGYSEVVVAVENQ